jgi:ParB family chromosome partitioning protein
MLELALIENIHREDLNPVERALAYRDLMDQFALTQEQAAQRVGEKRSTVANHLRLLDMSDGVLALITSGEISFGHAKVLASLAGQSDRQFLLAKRVAQEGLPVRQLEQLIAQLQQLDQGKGGGPAETVPGQQSKSAYLSDVERQLTEVVGTKVSIRPGRAKHSGRIVISYYSLDDFDRIAKSLGMSLES